MRRCIGILMPTNWRSKIYGERIRPPPETALTTEQIQWLEEASLLRGDALTCGDVTTVLDFLKAEQQENAFWMENMHVVRALRLLMQYKGWIVPRWEPLQGGGRGGLLLQQHSGLNNDNVLKVFHENRDYELFADTLRDRLKAQNSVAIPSPILSGQDLVDRVKIR